MKLATKISAGYLILIGLMLSALVYQASIIFSLNSMSEKLSQVNFQAAHLGYQLKQDLSTIKEFTQKFFVTRDEGFRKEMKKRKNRFAQDLDSLGDLSLSQAEAGKARELEEAWDDYGRKTFTPAADSEGSLSEDELLDTHLSLLDGLEQIIGETIQVIENSILVTVQNAGRAGRQADKHSLTAVGLAVLLGLVVSVPIIRSISNRLDRLT